jgi:hypothetical protein
MKTTVTKLIATSVFAAMLAIPLTASARHPGGPGHPRPMGYGGHGQPGFAHAGHGHIHGGGIPIPPPPPFFGWECAMPPPPPPPWGYYPAPYPPPPPSRPTVYYPVSPGFNIMLTF